MIQTYTSPSTFKYENGRSRFAYLTFIMRNESYLPGALVFAYGLRKQNTQADVICLVTKDISRQAQEILSIVFDKVVEVDEIYYPHERRQERQDRPFLFTRFQALRAGNDGDLGLGYEKVVVADADILPLRFYDHLFSLNAPAGCINESKHNCMEFDSSGSYIIPPSLAMDGKWLWHNLYDPICPHGSKIPKEITDRVKVDPFNLGVNSSLLVMKPSMIELKKIHEEAQDPTTYVLITRMFNWPEMQFATIYWSGQWTNIDLRFCSFNGYPQLKYLWGTHFAGYKPWKFKDIKTFTRFSRFPDYQLWQKMYLELARDRPEILVYKKLANLKECIIETARIMPNRTGQLTLSDKE